jgi:hypothetical protein
MKQTLATLDLTEQPHQRVWHIRRVRHCQEDGRIELRPGERPFAADYYSVLVEREERHEAVATAAGSISVALRGGARP